MTIPKYEPEYGTMKQSGVGLYVKLSDYEMLEAQIKELVRSEQYSKILAYEIKKLCQEMYYALKHKDYHSDDCQNYAELTNENEVCECGTSAVMQAIQKYEDSTYAN